MWRQNRKILCLCMFSLFRCLSFTYLKFFFINALDVFNLWTISLSLLKPLLQMTLKTLWQKEKLIMMSNFLFCHKSAIIKLINNYTFIYRDFQYFCLDVFKVVCCKRACFHINHEVLVSSPGSRNPAWLELVCNQQCKHLIKMWNKFITLKTFRHVDALSKKKCTFI